MLKYIFYSTFESYFTRKNKMTNAWVSLSAIENLRMFSDELDVELLQAAQHLDNHLLLWQDGRPEVVGARLLSKAGPRNDANASCLKKMRGVKNIGRLSRLLGSSESLLRELDLRECVHGSLHGV